MPQDVLYKGKVVASLLTEQDVPRNYLTDSQEPVSVVGYGSQGRHQSLNLRDSKVNVHLGLRKGGSSWEKALRDGWEAGRNLHTVEDASELGNIIYMLVPDMEQPGVYRQSVGPGMKEGKMLAYSHAFNHYYGRIRPPEGVDVGMIAPKSPGAMVRQLYVEGFGAPSLFAVDIDCSGHARDRVLGIAKGIGSTRPGILETTFKDEVETDLFGEQVFLCGGINEIIKAGTEVLIEAGYNPVSAYWEVHHEAMGLIAPLVYKHGSAGMLRRVSDTAKDGAFRVGPKVIGPSVKDAMRQALSDIQSRRYADGWVNRYETMGRRAVTEPLAELDEHPNEVVGKQVRKIMWPDQQVE